MTEATIVYHNGSVQVSDFHSIEEMNALDVDGQQKIRVWFSDPDENSTDYTDYHNGRVAEVNA